MSRVLFEGLEDDSIDLFIKLIKLLEKIEKWWIKEIDIPTSGEYTAEEYENIVWDDTTSINIEMLKIISDIAINDNKECLKIYEKIINTKKRD